MGAIIRDPKDNRRLARVRENPADGENLGAGLVTHAINWEYDGVRGARRQKRALAGTPTVLNVTLTSADTEYTAVLPQFTRRFEFQARTEVPIRYAWETGRVATPTAPYRTLKAGDIEYQDDVDTGWNQRTLYLASATAGTVVEIEYWTT